MSSKCPWRSIYLIVEVVPVYMPRRRAIWAARGVEAGPCEVARIEVYAMRGLRGSVSRGPEPDGESDGDRLRQLRRVHFLVP